ncbi:hypothetical protein HWV00_10910 [Moritella sp. 24]|uniref:hypothetical protein n=1 Tax=Moritella sp. 24 TaxID=2746230 RepID=UPI001BA89996|nr:hypothetical protein [Moritella sp. 24]QUM76698.1 hypothetical protein HWV00_10910 [Moritella sp. 24]
MNKITKLSLIVVIMGLLQACDITEPVSNKELKATENSAFTTDGRLFVVGENRKRESWIFEIIKNSDGSYAHIPYVKGTVDGTELGGINDKPEGEECRFAGLTASDSLLYAACIQTGGFLGLNTEAVSLFQVETTLNSERIKTGHMTDSNFIYGDGEESFDPNWFMANGMAVDSEGHIYISNSKAVLAPNRDSISQVTITDNGDSRFLDFNHKTWISGHELFPNGVQIEGDTLYYTSGSNILKVKINADFSASDVNVHYKGTNLAMIDDFAIHEGYIAYSKISVPGSVVILTPAEFEDEAKRYAAIPMAVIPSSVVYQSNLPEGNPLFDEGSLLVTSFLSGGLYRIEF